MCHVLKNCNQVKCMQALHQVIASLATKQPKHYIVVLHVILYVK